MALIIRRFGPLYVEYRRTGPDSWCAEQVFYKGHDVTELMHSGGAGICSDGAGFDEWIQSMADLAHDWMIDWERESQP